MTTTNLTDDMKSRLNAAWARMALDLKRGDVLLAELNFWNGERWVARKKEIKKAA